MNTVNKIQSKIDEMDYWDAKVLDFNSRYFGDEIEIIIEDEEDYVFRLKFTGCYDVSYKNAYVKDSDMEIKKLNRLQLGYFAQDISVVKSDMEGFYKFDLVLPMLFCTIVCKEISMERINQNQLSFFGSKML